MAVSDRTGEQRDSIVASLLTAGAADYEFVGVNESTVVYGFKTDPGERREDVRDAIEEAIEALPLAEQAEGAAGICSRWVDAEKNVASSLDLARNLARELFREHHAFSVGSEINHLAGGSLSLKEAKIALEKLLIAVELSRSRGNITRAASSLGIHRPQLSNLIKKHNVRREEFE